MAAAEVTADRKITSLILQCLSEQTYKYRRQISRDHPVEFLEFRPTLLPSILTNKLWADLGTSILWRRYPYIPALARMPFERRQWYANKVEKAWIAHPAQGGPELSYLGRLHWPLLETLELEVDWQQHQIHLTSLLHEGLAQLELSASQTGGSQHTSESTLPVLFGICKNLRGLHLGPGSVHEDDPLHGEVLSDALDSTLR